jgi:hypothetical protein
MSVFRFLRLRAALVGIASATLACSGAAAAAASPTSIDFTIQIDHSVTNFVTCPPGTPANVILCGYGANESITNATNSAGDAGLTGSTMRVSFASELEAPTTVPGGCAMQFQDASAVTLKTTRGDIYLVTRGAYCASTNTDVEPFVIVGGTGAYTGATGSGVVNAYQSAAPTPTQGFSVDAYTGTLIPAR